jgi:ABC-2 type transport system ATP-binding protein
MLGIEVNGIKKLYPNGNIGIESVSFSIRKGTITAYLGPNGAGKTTTLNIFSTLLKPDFGECFIDGLDVVEEGDKVRDAIGYLPEDERFKISKGESRRNLGAFRIKGQEE